jgi:prolyl-tRNA editing enzyme YbaK/EbsC (Cys-tRNA(Pro) deacylase)
MSKSLKRVAKEAADLGLDINIIQLDVPTKTAQEAADAMACDVDQILKSIIFLGAESQTCILFMTAGGNRVCTDKASTLAGEPLMRADAAVIRAQTGFAIGGVSPLGHISEVRKFMDQTLLTFDDIWAAAGTPHSMFSINPQDLQTATGAIVSDFTE